MMNTCIIVLAAAFVVDRVLGDPHYGLHPVRLIGRLIGGLESGIRRLGLDSRFGGTLLLVLTVLAVVVVYGTARIGLSSLHAAAPVALDIFILYSCIAQRDMERHATPIAKALREGETEKARELVSGIVGRDVSGLDAAGIARAVVESVAEGFLDGFFSPLCWFVAGAAATRLLNMAPLPTATGMVLVYRVVNTLDSMVGYRNERYGRLGWASANADDALNFLPARMALPLMVPAAALCGLDAIAGWRIALRDRLKHASPNSAHTESFAAGALGVRLGGPTLYPHGTVEKPWIGDTPGNLSDTHIGQTCRLTACAGWISCIVATIILAGTSL